MKLRGLLLAISGRYVNQANGHGYVRTELYSALPESVLERDVELRKRGPGMYTVTVKGHDTLVFDLYSRRRQSRDAPE